MSDNTREVKKTEESNKKKEDLTKKWWKKSDKEQGSTQSGDTNTRTKRYYGGLDRFRSKRPSNMIGDVIPLSDYELINIIHMRFNKYDSRIIKDYLNAIKNWCENNQSTIKEHLNPTDEQELDNLHNKAIGIYNGSLYHGKKFKDAALEYTQYVREKLEAQAWLNQLRKVGEKKPLGYVPIRVLTKFKVEIENFRKQLEESGINTIIVQDEEDSALFGYHQSLEKMIQDNANTIKKSGCPTNVEGYIAYIYTRHISSEENQEFFDFIADTYADHTNRFRSDVRT
jgi:hypothetical protein